MTKSLSRETQEKIDQMVERVARKAGYTGKENWSYKEHIQVMYEQQYLQAKFEKLKKKLEKNRKKIFNTDFAEEIRTYLQDGLIDLMNEGYTEEEALKITLEKFDEADLKENFDEFAKSFEDFGMQYEYELAKWYTKNGEAIGLFYSGFLILGMAVGAFLGYLFGHTWINTLIGLGLGTFIGIAFGLFSHAILAMKREEL